MATMPVRDTNQGRSFLLDEDSDEQLKLDAGRGALLDEPEEEVPITQRMSNLFGDAVQVGQEQIAGARAGIGTLVSEPQFREQYPLTAGAATMADLALHWGTALFGAAAGTVRGGVEAATAPSPEVAREEISKFPEVFAETAHALTLGPLTPQGAKAAEVTDQAIKILGKMRKGAGEWVYDQTESPVLATLAETTLAGATMVLAPLAIGKVARGIGEKVVEKPRRPTVDETPAPKVSDQPELILADTARKDTSTVPAETQAAVERGHITRAHRLARQRGITYGEAIREVVSQTKTPAAMEHLVPVKGPRELLIGEDTRTFSAMKNSIFDETVLPLADPTTAAVAGRIIGRRPAVPDVNVIVRDVTAMVAPHKFLGDRHPILKWGIDKIDRGARNVEAKSNEILWGMELVPERFGTARREGVPHKSDRGALVIFERLPLKDQIKLLDDAQSANLAGRAMAEAEKADWTGPMRLAYKQLRLGTDAVLGEINTSAKVTGGTGIKNRPGYLPNIWTGDFRVFIRDAKGDLVKVVGASSRRQANAVKKGIEAEMTGYKGSVEAVKRKGKGESSVEAFQDAIRSLKQGTPEAQLLEKTFNDIMARRGFGKHRLQRKGVEGFMGSEGGIQGVRSFIKSYQFYVDGGLRFSENMKTFHETNKAFADPDMIRAYPNTLETLRKWREHSVGARGKIDQVISDWSRNALGETAIARGLGKVNQLTLIAKLFMWNGRFMAAQGIQPFQVIPAKLVNLSSQGFRGSVLKSIAQANKSFLFPDAGAAESIRFAIQNGTVAPKFVKELQDVLVTNKASWMTGDVPGLLTGQRLAGRIEEYSRMMANLQFYHFLKNSNVPHRTAVESAAYLTDKYMVEYSTVARPMIYGSKGLGTLGKPVGLFKTFQHNYLAQMVEHVQLAKKGKPGGLATFVGSQVLAAGLMGVIGRETADNMLQAMGQPTLSEMILRSGAPDWITWGVPSASVDVDLTTTLAAPGLGMGDFFSLPGYEYVGKSVYEAINWGVKKAKGTQTPMDSMKFWNQVSPSSMKGLIEKHYTREGLTPHPTKHGYGTFRRDTRAWGARFFAGRTLEESRALKAVWQTTRAEERDRQSLDQLVDLSAWAMGNNEDVPSWVFDAAIDQYNVKPRAFQRMVKDRFNKSSMSIIEQYTNFEKSHRGRIRAERLEEMGATDSEGAALGRGDLLD